MQPFCLYKVPLASLVYFWRKADWNWYFCFVVSRSVFQTVMRFPTNIFNKHFLSELYMFNVSECFSNTALDSYNIPKYTHGGNLLGTAVHSNTIRYYVLLLLLYVYH